MDTPSKIFAILKKKRYNRDEPHLKNKIVKQLHYFVSLNHPVKLVGFWGVGFKSKSNWADSASCEFLLELNREVKEVYPLGIEFVFIFATLHGVHNGIKEDTMQSYIKDIERLFKKYDFKYYYLDALWQKYGISFKKIDAIYQQKPSNWWSKIENAELIEINAKKRNKRLNPKTAAQKYYIMRDLEKEMLKEEFTDSVFHAFSDPRLRAVLPDLPTLYFYSRKGWSDTPWFVE